MTNKAYEYAENVLKGDAIAPKYVKLTCKEFKSICDDKNDTYFFDEDLFRKVQVILKMLDMAKGPRAGQSIAKALAGYQWLLIAAALCVKYRDDPNKRRYQTVVLEICRKNGKTFTIAILFILLFYLEPQFSKFYSVAPDGSLAREIKEAIEPLISVNVEKGVIDENEFKVIRDYIQHRKKKTKYIPLNYSTNRMDGKEPNVFIADEVGALPNNYPVEAMRSGQILVKNKLGFIISTKYPTIDNPFEDEVAAAKRILDGTRKDDSVFSLLYEPDKTKNWMTDDTILAQGNPLALEIKPVWDDLLKKREDAIDRDSLRENFLTKHCNIIYQGEGTESYIDVQRVRECRTEKIDWTGRDVYVGVDLSMTNDNTSIGIVSEENGKILADSFAFIPEGRIAEKNKAEHIDYRRYIRQKKCFACGDMTIDYGFVEDFVFNLEEKLGCRIMAIGYDRYNALSSAQKWDEVYETIEIKQHSSVLHPPTKLLYEKIMNHEFEYERNDLLEINFQNARCTFDTNMNRYVNKKHSNGKVDMVVSMINAVCLLQQDCFLGSGGFVAQVI